MINPVPLLIVMGTILALLVIQRVLVRAQFPRQNDIHSTPDRRPPSTQPTPSIATPVPARPRGRTLVAGISVTGLDERGVSSLKALISKNDISAITTFLAFNRPGFIEIDDFLSQQRQLANAAGQPVPQTPIAPLFKSLSEGEREHLLRFSPKTPRLISRDLMARFGGHEFSNYFSHYAARPQSVTLHVPPFDPDRKIFEGLTKSGIARKGRHIPLDARLTVLKMSQLRQMAKDLNFDKKFSRKTDATQMLADVPGAAVLLSMQYVVDDLFLLLPLDEDIEQIKSEWTYLETYAKLLGGLKSKSAN